MSKILAVDDNQDITDMVKELLEFNGYSCTTANSSRACLNLLRSEQFDLILLDLAMPEMSGVDLLKEIKADSSLKHNKIILFTSSYITDSEINELIKLGALSCIRKPINKDKLIELIKRHI